MQIKANNSALGVAGKAAVTPEQKQQQELEIQENISQLQAHVDKLENYKASSQYLSMADNDKIVQLQERAKMQIELLESLLHALQTGTAFDPSAAPLIDHSEMVEYMETQLGTGFHDDNGELILFDESDMVDANGNPMITVPGYAGTVMLENSGQYDPLNPTSTNALFYVLDEDVVAVTARTEGQHIYIHEELVDGSERVVKLADMATRNEPIYIHAGNANQAVRIDLSQATRMADGNWGEAFGTQKGFFVGGSQHDDVIIGSSGKDIIWGDLGDDTIYGLGGRDEIYGDLYNQVGAAQFTDNDGNDTIHGGAGIDVIRAGGGNQDIVINGKGDLVSEDEKKGLANTYYQPDVQNIEWLQNSPAWEGTYAPDGTLVINGKSDQSGPLQIWMDDQFSMMSANKDSNGTGLVITMAGFNEEGDAIEMRVRINDFFSQEVQLEINGNDSNNIIDFSDVTLHGQHVVLSGGDGHDIMFAPKSELDHLGIPLENFGSTSVSETELLDILQQNVTVYTDVHGQEHQYMTWGMPAHPDSQSGAAAWDGYNEEIGGFLENGEIVLRTMDGWPETLNFATPAGYERAYLTTDPAIIGPDGDPKLVFIKRNPDGTIEQATVTLEGLPDDQEILIDGVPVKEISHLPITVAGGDGEDTVFGSSSSMQTSGVEQSVTGTYDFNYDFFAAPAMSLQAQIDEATIAASTAEAALGPAQSARDAAMESIKNALAQVLDKTQSPDYTDAEGLPTQAFDQHVEARAHELLEFALQHLGSSATTEQWVKWLKEELLDGYLISEDAQGNSMDPDLTILASNMITLVNALKDVDQYKTELSQAEYKLEVLKKKQQGPNADESSEDE